MSTLQVNNLKIELRKDKNLIVDDISFELNAGSSLTLLGQSGCGKTMACRALMGLLDDKKFHIAGSVKFHETELLHLPARERRKIYGKKMAFIPQNPMTAFDPSVRIGRQMDETIKLHMNVGRKRRKEMIRNSLDRAGLEAIERVVGSYPHELSGGMLQRVLIAIAISTDAEIVIADEPTTALDVVHCNEIVDEFIKLKEAGMAVLFVTHDFAAAIRLGGDVLVMKEGKTVEQGNMKDSLSGPWEMIMGYLPMRLQGMQAGIRNHSMPWRKSRTWVLQDPGPDKIFPF